MANLAAFAAPLSLLRTTRHVTIPACARVSAARTMMAAPPTRSTNPAPLPTVRSPARPKLTLLYDGECPLCMKEVTFLRMRSKDHDDSLGFVDIASPSYDAAAHADVRYDVAMGRIHAIDDAGRVITGVKVFRDAYEAVGLGWVYALTKVPGVSWLSERVYEVWADRRLELTGRPPLVDLLRARERTCRK